MVRAEIVIGLQNAINRGEGLQKSMQSMINAGYSVQDVQEASQNLDMGATGLMNQSVVSSIIEPNTVSQVESPKKSSSRGKVIILSIIFLILLGIASYVAYTMFKK